MKYVAKNIGKGLIPILVILFFAGMMFSYYNNQINNWVSRPEQHYMAIKETIEKNPALFDENEIKVIQQFMVTGDIASKASKIAREGLCSQMLRSVVASFIVILTMSVITLVTLYKEDPHEKSQSQQISTVTIFKTAVDAEFRFIEQMMVVCGIMISFFGGATIMRGSANLLSQVSFVALTASLITGFFSIAYLRGGIYSEENHTINLSQKVDEMLDLIEPWQFWLLVQGIALFIVSII